MLESGLRARRKENDMACKTSKPKNDEKKKKMPKKGK